MWTWRSRNSWILHQKLRDESVFMQGVGERGFSNFLHKNSRWPHWDLKSAVCFYIKMLCSPLINRDNNLHSPLGKITCVQACSHGWGCGRVQCNLPNLPKGSLLATKWAKNEGQGGWEGQDGWSPKSPLWGSKRSTFGGSYIFQINPGYRPVCVPLKSFIPPTWRKLISP